MERVEVLELAKALFNKEMLSDEEAMEWNQIDQTEDLTTELIERMNEDAVLTQAVLNYLAKNGFNWEQIIFGAVAMGNYILAKCWPNDCGYDAFNKFWIEPSEMNPEAHIIIGQAANRAFDRMITSEAKKQHDEYRIDDLDSQVTAQKGKNNYAC